jgi:quercetin dioxygenase-like cupin family protein
MKGACAERNRVYASIFPATFVKIFIMSEPVRIPWHFLTYAQTELEEVPPGRTHHWYTKPNSAQSDSLVFVRAQLAPGAAHAFHNHPEMDEIIYVLSGEAEQWFERDRRMLKPGDAVYIPRGVVHGTYNSSNAELDFLAILTPAKISGPMTVEVVDQEPWRSLRK